MGRYKQIEEIVALMNDQEKIRNVSIIAHVDHGKTTLAISLLRLAGIHANPDSDPDLETRMTVFPSNVSLAHKHRQQEYLIHLIDTPGHIDFNPAVTRSLRAVDGAIIVVDAVEGLMTQTITVLKQALHEKVKPILFINKVDRLIREKKLSAQEIQNQLAKIIQDVNDLIKKNAPVEHRDWQLKVGDGRIAFGSAKDEWGLNPAYNETGVTFNEVTDAYTEVEKQTQKIEELRRKVPLAKLILNMIVDHLPSPIQAQHYRQTQIWRGNPESNIGVSMSKANPRGPLLMCVTAIEEDRHRGLIIIGRVFSGTIERGKATQLVTEGKKGTIQQCYLVMCDDKLPVEKIPAGNIAALSGLPRTHVGETVAECDIEVQPFEALQYVSEPVVTMAIEPANAKDLPQFIKVIQRLITEDPSLRFAVNDETGEYLISGMGELHLEVTIKIIQRTGLKIKTGAPIVIYRETIGHSHEGPPVMGKSPNKHNKLWITMEKLSESVIEAIKSGKLNEMQKRDEKQKVLKELGWSTDDARNVVAIADTNMLVNRIKGRQYIEEVIDHVKTGFKEAVSTSVLAKEPAYGLKINLEDIALHEDPVHRGPAQIQPMIRRAVWCAFLLNDPKLLEPIMTLECKVPTEFMSSVTAIVQKRRGRIADVRSEDEMTVINAEIPVSESFGLADELRSSTQGKALWATQFSRWAYVPEKIQSKIVSEIRQRKGLTTKPPEAEEFLEPQ